MENIGNVSGGSKVEKQQEDNEGVFRGEIKYTGTVYHQKCRQCDRRIDSGGEPQLFTLSTSEGNKGLEEYEAELKEKQETWAKDWSDEVDNFFKEHEGHEM